VSVVRGHPGRVRLASRLITQQPLSEKPGTTLVRFTEPPSVVGTAGPQIGPPAAPAEDAPADDAVVLAALDDDESGASPGSWTGVWELPDDGALFDADELDRLAVPAAVDPLAVAPFVAVPVAAVLTPAAEVDEVDEEVADAPVELDVVLVPTTPVVLLSGAGVVLLLDVIPFDVPAVVPCMLVDVVVWAWSAVAPNRTSATAKVTAIDARGFIRSL
jgi:hypothetical protein